MRTSTREVQAVFERLCKAADVEPLGLPGGTPIYYRDEWGDGTPRTCANRGWSLENAPEYGGWVICGHGFHDTGTGESRPFGDRRRTAKDFVSHMHFAISALTSRDRVAA